MNFSSRGRCRIASDGWRRRCVDVQETWSGAGGRCRGFTSTPEPLLNLPYIKSVMKASQQSALIHTSPVMSHFHTAEKVREELRLCHHRLVSPHGWSQCSISSTVGWSECTSLLLYTNVPAFHFFMYPFRSSRHIIRLYLSHLRCFPHWSQTRVRLCRCERGHCTEMLWRRHVGPNSSLPGVVRYAAVVVPALRHIWPISRQDGVMQLVAEG